jgi:voltage-gated potassium channel
MMKRSVAQMTLEPEHLAKLHHKSGVALKTRVYEILELAHPDDSTSRYFQTLIFTLIGLNVIALIIDSDTSLSPAKPLLGWFEVISIFAFSVEYLLRLWSCTAASSHPHPLWGRIRFATTPLAIVDLLAVLPFYLPFVGVNLIFVRAVRLVRVFRIAKLVRYSEAIRTFGRVLARKKEELIVASFVLSLSVMFASILMYFAESDAQPQQFSSIPATIWWMISSYTVRRQEIYPVTFAGKCVATSIAVLSVGIFALPTAILGSGFLEEMQRRHRVNACPHCGRQLDASESR